MDLDAMLAEGQAAIAWAAAGEAKARFRAAWDVAQRTGSRVTQAELSAMLLAAHQAVPAAEASSGPRDGGGYDPVPDLARLIDGLPGVAAAGAGPDHHYHSGLVQALADLLAGPYTALREGLRLDEPGLKDPGTTAAIYRGTSVVVRWAPYRESGPDARTFEPPPGPVMIRATGYRDYDVVIYWEKPS
jgi:hypothetical protein